MTKKKKPYDASDPEQIKDAEEKEKNERDQYLKDLKVLMSTPEGVRFFRKLMEDGKMFTTSFTGNSVTFFNEGMRNLVLKVFGDVCEAAPDKVHLIILGKEINDARS